MLPERERLIVPTTGRTPANSPLYHGIWRPSSQLVKRPVVAIVIALTCAAAERRQSAHAGASKCVCDDRVIYVSAERFVERCAP